MKQFHRLSTTFVTLLSILLLTGIDNRSPVWGQSAESTPRHSQPITAENVDTLTALSTIQASTQGISSLALSPDDRLLAYGSYDDHAIHIVDVMAGKEVMTLQGHTAPVTSLVFSPNGKLLASTGTVNLPPAEDGSVRLWDVYTGKQLAMFATPGISQLAFHPDGTLLAGAGGGDPVNTILWNVNTFSEKMRLQDVFGSVAFSSDKNLLATAGRDNFVHLMNFEAGKETMLFQGHTGWVQAIAFSPDGKLLASGGDDHMIRLWGVETGKSLKQFSDHSSTVAFLAFDPNGTILASWENGINITKEGGQIRMSFRMKSDENVVRFWDAKSGTKISKIQSVGGISQVAFSADWTMIATANPEGLIQIWGIPSSNAHRSATPPSSGSSSTRPISSTLTPTLVTTPTLRAIVTIEQLNLRKGPGINYPIVSALHQGEQVEVVGQSNHCTWLQVVTSTGQIGWVSGYARYITLNLPCPSVP